MGYRSNVTFIIAGEPDKIKAFMVEQRLVLKAPDVGWDLWSELQQFGKDGVAYIVFQNESVKWYESYGDVQFFSKFFNAATTENDFCCAFVRIGEDDNDIETNYAGSNPYDLVRVIRTTEVGIEIPPK